MRYRLLSLGEAGLVKDGGASVDFPMGKPFGILAYLALATDPVSRDELAAVFWNDGDRSRARHSLRQALSFIRSRLGEDFFASDDPAVVDPAVLGTDVDVLRQALRDEDVDRIVELYGGPFLETFQLTSSPAWDHWVEIQRRILEERVAAVLRDEAARVESGERAVELLRRVVEIEPHRVEHRRALVDCLLERGEVEAATGVVAEARQAELDDPDALDELEARVRSVREERRVRSEDRGDLHPEFVGRTAELAALTATWREAVRGRRGIAILNGPTGIGKTRLAEELAALASGTGQVVHVKASTMERRLDWSVTAELARSLYRLPGAAGVGAGAMNVLRSLVPSLGGSSAPSPPITPRPVAVSDALADLVSAVAYETPLLIVLDDMQWVDRASLALLLRMVRQLRDEPVMVVLTFRSEELESREYDAIQALVREESASVSLLHTLGEAEVQEMLALDLAEPPERIERLAAQLHDVTRGHPLFLVELLRSLRDDGVLVRDEDGWRFRESGPVRLELPASVRLVIHRRLEQLSDEAQRVGTELASLPPSAGLERIRARTGLSDADFTRGLNELVDRAVIRWAPNGRLEFTHDQLREAMTEETRRSSRWPYAAAALALAVAGAAAVASLATGEDISPTPYGGGTVLLVTGDSVTALIPTSGTDHWAVAPASIWVPDDPDIMSRPRPRRLTDGTIAWTTALHDLQQAPEGVVYRSGTRDRTVFSWPGDDGIIGISPDGSGLLWVTEHLATEQYDKELRIVRAPGDTGRVLAGPASVVTGRWSPDGTRIAVTVELARDSLLLVSPRGDRLMARNYFSAHIEDWCGPDGVLLLARDSATAPMRRILLDVWTGKEIVLEAVATPSAVCSPDGTAYLSRQPGPDAAITLTELTSGEREQVPAPVTGATIHWIPDTVDPVPVGLETTERLLTLGRGERVLLDSRIVMSDSSRQTAEVHWTSLNPSVASVLGDGSVAANRRGRATVVAEYARWFTDTVRLHVLDAGGQEIVLSDDFRNLDTLAWLTVGEPTVDITPVDGRPVLKLLGDGRYADGIVTRRPVASPTGLTLELEFRMPLNTNQYQDFRVFLGEMTPPPGAGDRQSWESWNRTAWLAMVLPAFELDKWSPRLVKLWTHSRLEEIAALPHRTDPATWTHVAVQIQADGLATLWFDREKVAETALNPAFLSRPLRVAIFGRTYNTEAFVRNLAWWAEPRYR